MRFKNLLIGLVALGAMAWLGGLPAAAEPPTARPLLPMPEMGEDGLYQQPWFLQSFLDLREDVRDAAAKGKRLALLWEQRGCPYCKELHVVNFRDPEIVDYIRTHFEVIQLNLRGARHVTDFDGTVLTERELARRYAINFTPTIQFFPTSLDKIAGKIGQEAEVWRLLGYWKPFHFINSFVYVQENAYETDLDFQEWLSARAKKLRAEGKDVKLW